MATSKNNPDARKAVKQRMVTSSECEKCHDKCSKGINYLNQLSKSGQGNGVMCQK